MVQPPWDTVLITFLMESFEDKILIFMKFKLFMHMHIGREKKRQKEYMKK